MDVNYSQNFAFLETLNKCYQSNSLWNNIKYNASMGEHFNMGLK